MPGQRILGFIRGLRQRPIVGPMIDAGIAAARGTGSAARTVLVGDNSGAANILHNPAAYGKLIAYCFAAIATLASRWWGIDIGDHTQQVAVDFVVAVIGGWGVWRVPNASPAPADTTAE